MLEELVAEYFGVENDENLSRAIQSSGITILDWLEDSPEVRNRLMEAMNKQTDVMIEAAMKDPANQQKLINMLMELNQSPNIRVTGLPISNRNFRRRLSKKRFRA